MTIPWGVYIHCLQRPLSEFFARELDPHHHICWQYPAWPLQSPEVMPHTLWKSVGLSCGNMDIHGCVSAYGLYNKYPERNNLIGKVVINHQISSNLRAPLFQTNSQPFHMHGSYMPTIELCWFCCKFCAGCILYGSQSPPAYLEASSAHNGKQILRRVLESGIELPRSPFPEC